MASKFVEVTGPRGIDQMLELVTITCQNDIRGAATNLAEIVAEGGMKAAICDDISKKKYFVDAVGSNLNADIFGWLEEGDRWWEDNHLALHSPLPRACRYECEPFWVNQHGFHLKWSNSYLAELDTSDLFECSSHKAAIIVPVHLPFGQISANCLVSLDSEKEELFEEFRLYGSLFVELIRRFVAGYVQAMRTIKRIPSDCILTKREIECLHFAAQGKTDSEIALILHRSHATIRYHIHRAGTKLDCVNRAQTIFKASQLGYLGNID
ncbi:MAG: LuxR C-terminal-related transcriptional regulator [Pseudomonadota bacterium]